MDDRLIAFILAAAIAYLAVKKAYRLYQGL